MSENQLARGMSIRSAAPTDLGAIKGLYAQLAPDVSNVDTDFPAILSDPNAGCWILENEGELIGMVICYVRPTLSSGNMMTVEELVIDQRHRRRGLGSILVKYCVDYAKARKLDCVEVACSLVKTELHEFYERVGFKHRMRLYSLFLAQE